MPNDALGCWLFQNAHICTRGASPLARSCPRYHGHVKSLSTQVEFKWNQACDDSRKLLKAHPFLPSRTPGAGGAVNANASPVIPSTLPEPLANCRPERI